MNNSRYFLPASGAGTSEVGFDSLAANRSPHHSSKVPRIFPILIFLRVKPPRFAGFFAGARLCLSVRCESLSHLIWNDLSTIFFLFPVRSFFLFFSFSLEGSASRGRDGYCDGR